MLKLKKESLYLLGLVIFLAIISALIIRNFIVPLIFTAILVYLFHPVHKKLLKVFKSHLLTSLISVFIILTLLIVPTVLTLWEVSKEIKVLENQNIEQSLDSASTYINNEYQLNLNLTKEYKAMIGEVKIQIRTLFINKIPEFIFNVFIVIFFFYYFLKNYDKENSYFKMFVKKVKLNNFRFKIKRLLDGIFYGQIFTRFIQALIGTILFLIIGVEGAIVFGAIMFFAAFLPVVGTSLVWGPIVLFNLVQANYTLAILVFISGVIISLVDNFLLPYIISQRTNIGPVITLMSILGGIQLFGIYGIILGPFFVGVFFVFLEEFIVKYRKDNHSKKRYVWTKEEREKFKKLKTQIGKDEYERMLNKKYVTNEAQGSEVIYRYVFRD